MYTAQKKNTEMFLSKIKRISRKFITLASLATIFSCASESYSNRMKEEEPITDKQKQEFDIKKLQSLIDKGYKQMSQSVEQSIIVIGDTGTGKSTLINGLIGKKLEVIENEQEDFVIRLELGQEGRAPLIGEKISISETSIPYIWRDSYENIYWDCPGFEDTKGPIQDIANAFFIKKIFDNSKYVKLVIVISDQQLKTKGGLLNLNKKLAETFENFNEIKDSLSVILTKANDRRSIDNFRKIIIKIAEEQDNQNCTKAEKYFYEHLAKSEVVAIFHEPKNIGPVFIDPKIHQAIQDTTYINSPKINIPISYSSSLHLYKLVDASKTLIENKNSQFLANFCTLLGNNERHTSMFAELHELCDYHVIVSRILDAKDQIDAGDYGHYFRFVEEFCDKCHLEYDLKQDLEVVSFCKLIIKDNKERLSHFINNVFVDIRRLINDKAKNIIDKIEVKYSELRDSFIADSKNYLNTNRNNKPDLLNFAQHLEKFSIAENIEVIPDLSALDKILNLEIIKELIIMHKRILDINEKIKIFGEIIPNQSQIIKNHLNERLNDVKKEIKNIYNQEQVEQLKQRQELQRIEDEQRHQAALKAEQEKNSKELERLKAEQLHILKQTKPIPPYNYLNGQAFLHEDHKILSGCDLHTVMPGWRGVRGVLNDPTARYISEKYVKEGTKYLVHPLIHSWNVSAHNQALLYNEQIKEYEKRISNFKSL
jgi:GTPase SAR1 family protein